MSAFERHVLQRTIVLPEQRVLFLPVPKAGCTSLLWTLAAIAGIPPERFQRSAGTEASSSLTIHDQALWPAEHRLSRYEGEERERVLTEDGWLRFSVVRQPATRLWSAWQSKLLLREPRFGEQFGEEPWFPRVPEQPEDLVEDFRRFVGAVGRGEAEDVHWSIQHDLVTQFDMTHVGRMESLRDTLDVLREHVGGEAAAPAKRERRENQSPLPLPADAYDEAAAAVLREHYAADFEAYGYDPSELGGQHAEAWREQTAELLPALRATIDDRERLVQLSRVAKRRERRVQDAEAKLEAMSARQVGHARSPVITNLEGETEFNVRWGWAEGRTRPGFTGVVRVKNEARTLPFSLPPLLRAVERVVLIDNGSTDGTADVARETAAEHGAADRLDVVEYPFSISRCGSEHLGTPATSVHSLAYFYNWSFAHVRTGYALKWDGDMVLTDAAVGALRDLAWQLEAAEVVIRVPRYPLYLSGDDVAYLDTGLRNNEPWGWPNRPGYSFVKAMDWELPLWGGEPGSIVLPDWGCAEIKHLDEDEFGHWSHTDFDASARTKRKLREWQVFNALVKGDKPPPGTVRIEAPAGVNVVDHVRTVWLPERAGTSPAAVGAGAVA